jgi:NADPH:quinone reductase-like Zn-dependent oxidoreductase
LQMWRNAMKAAVIYEHGGPEQVKVEGVPEPEAGEGEIVLEVRSAALNHLDIWVRKGRRGLELPMPHILGCDAAGVVVEVGPGTHGVSIGDEVVLNSGLSCGCCESCYRGEHSECASFGIVGMTRPGTFAEKVAVPFCNAYPKPSHLSFDEAAALALSYQTAWRMLMTRAIVIAGETVLVHGVGGGVALAALQLAKLAGAEVIVTSSSAEKLARAEQLGADHTINYEETADVAERVRDITRGRGVDIVIDTVGAATWSTDFDVVRRGGRIVLCGVTTGAEAKINLQKLYWNQLTILGSTMGSNEDFRQMLKAAATAGLKPVIDSVLPLERVREAMSRMEAAEQFGKIVLRISE